MAAIALLFVVVAPVAATSDTLAPACSGVNVRAAAATSAPIVVKLGLSATVTVSGTVAGASWSATCPTARSGSTWYSVTAINGTAVSLLYGVSVLYAATGVLAAPNSATATTTATPAAVPTPVPSTPAPAPTPGPTIAPPSVPAAPPPAPGPTGGDLVLVPGCAGVNLRTAASTSSKIVAKLGVSASVTVSGTKTGAAWKTTCPMVKSGSGWYIVTKVNGTSVSALYGVGAVYAAAGVLVTPPGVAPAAIGTVTLGTTTTFFGRGYGHGVGLSQYGAQGRALAGQSAVQILAHYYQGTTIGTVAPETKVRVLVLDGFAATTAAPLTLAGRGGAWSVDGIAATFPADAILRLSPPQAGQATWRMAVTDTAGKVLYDAPAPADARVRGTTATTTLQLISKPSNFDLYRGTLRWIASGGTVAVVNELPLEAYLRGVVPAEMPSSWPVEARLAQTIAARSFAAYRLHPSTGTFDVYDDTRSQVYGGVHREAAASDATVAATANQVLLSGTAVVNALFHSTGGGATENNENAFVSATGAKVAGVVSYLRGSSDRDPSGASYDAAAPYATWQSATFTIAQLSAIFGADSRTAVGTLSALNLSNRGVSGRLISVTLVGSGGARTVSGQVFVDVFNANRPAGDPVLRSTLFSLGPIS